MALVNDAYNMSPQSQALTFSAPKSYYNTGRVTQTGTLVSISEGDFTQEMVGGSLVYGSVSGSPTPTMILSYVSSKQVTVADSKEITQGIPFEVWYGGFNADANGNISYVNTIPSGNGLVGGASRGTYTARAGGGQANATVLTTQFANVNVVATTGDSVKLPANAADGSFLRVANNAANSMNVFPHVGGTINSGSLNAAVAQAAGASATYVYYGSNNWVKM